MPPDAASAPATLIKNCRHGRMLYMRHDLYVGRSLDLYGEYCQGESELFAQLLRPGQVAVEVGANIGSHTVHLAQLVGPTGRVLAFEPQLFVFSLLSANLVLNEQFHARAIHAAVGSAEGSVRVPVLDPRVSQNFGGLSLRDKERGEEVRQTTLDRHELPSLRLLKVDVEGMESEVLLGGRQTIARHRPILYVENDRRENSARLIVLIKEMDYRLYWHLPRLFNPHNFARRAENVFGNVVSINMLCVPSEADVSLDGFNEVSGPDDWAL